MAFYRCGSGGGTGEPITFSEETFTLSNQTGQGTTNRTFTYTLPAGKEAKYVGMKKVTAADNRSDHANGASVVSFSQSGTTLSVVVGVVHGGNNNFPHTVTYNLIIEAVC